MTDENDGSIFDDAPASVPHKSSPPFLDPARAQRYRETALTLYLEGEDAQAKRLKPAKVDLRLLECKRFLQAWRPPAATDRVSCSGR